MLVGKYLQQFIRAPNVITSSELNAVRYFAVSGICRESAAVESASQNADSRDDMPSKKELQRAYNRQKQEINLQLWREKRSKDPDLIARWEFRKDIRKLGQEGEWEAILAKLDGAKVAGFPPMDLGLLQRGVLALSQCNRFEEAKEIMLHMKRRGFQPTEKIFNAVIAAAGREGAWQRAYQEMRNMQCWRGRPNLHTYNLVIRAMGRAGQWNKALKLSEEMQKKSIRPDNAHFNYLVLGQGAAGRWDKAIRIFKEMRRRKLKIGKKEFNTLLFALARNSQASRAVDWLEKMKEEDIEPDLFSYLSVATSLDAKNETEKAIKLLNEVLEKGLNLTDLPAVAERRKIELIDLRLVQTVPHAYGILGRFDEMVQYLDHMADNGPHPDQHTYQLALDLAERSPNPTDAIALVEKSMQRNGVKRIPFEKYS